MVVGQEKSKISLEETATDVEERLRDTYGNYRRISQRKTVAGGFPRDGNSLPRAGRRSRLVGNASGSVAQRRHVFRSGNDLLGHGFDPDPGKRNRSRYRQPGIQFQLNFKLDSQYKNSMDQSRSSTCHWQTQCNAGSITRRRNGGCGIHVLVISSGLKSDYARGDGSGRFAMFANDRDQRLRRARQAAIAAVHQSQVPAKNPRLPQSAALLRRLSPGRCAKLSLIKETPASAATKRLIIPILGSSIVMRSRERYGRKSLSSTWRVNPVLRKNQRWRGDFFQRNFRPVAPGDCAC